MQMPFVFTKFVCTSESTLLNFLGDEGGSFREVSALSTDVDATPFCSGSELLIF